MKMMNKYPELIRQIELFCQKGRNEFLSNMLQTDKAYERLCHERSNSSMILKDALVKIEMDALFENYSDAVYEQEIYELNAVYKKAFYDALNLLIEQGLLR